jgi:hypothetical protein
MGPAQEDDTPPQDPADAAPAPTRLYGAARAAAGRRPRRRFAEMTDFLEDFDRSHQLNHEHGGFFFQPTADAARQPGGNGAVTYPFGSHGGCRAWRLCALAALGRAQAPAGGWVCAPKGYQGSIDALPYNRRSRPVRLLSKRNNISGVATQRSTICEKWAHVLGLQNSEDLSRLHRNLLFEHALHPHFKWKRFCLVQFS